MEDKVQTMLEKMAVDNPCVEKLRMTDFCWGDGSQEPIRFDPLPFVPKDFFFKKVNAKSIQAITMKQCANKCGKTSENSTLFLCSRCKIAWYCSKECQKAQYPQHKGLCRAGFSAEFPAGIESTIQRLTAKWGMYLPMGREPYVGGFWVVDLDDTRIPGYIRGTDPRVLDIFSDKARQWFDCGAEVFVWFHMGNKPEQRGGRYFTCLFHSQEEANSFGAEL
jgi:hypothetical protein